MSDMKSGCKVFPNVCCFTSSVTGGVSSPTAMLTLIEQRCEFSVRIITIVVMVKNN